MSFSSNSIESDRLAALVAALHAAGVEVIGPRRRADAVGSVAYGRVASMREIVLDRRPVASLKAFFLPPTEPVLRYTKRGRDIDLAPTPLQVTPRVVIGALPCDAAALPIVDKVMDWDFHDEPWFARREATTILSVACDKADGDCFCTGVGAGPDDPRGSDVLLVPVPGGYHAEVHSEKGQMFVQTHAAFFAGARGVSDADAFRTRARAGMSQAAKLDTPAIRAWIEAHFTDETWSHLSEACHACGACASVCPTCHCFDLVDEQEGATRGTRRRNWDTCQCALFTLHGGGHNPRSDQGARMRQRLSHKFAIYPSRFGVLLCTGCGRCTRACPAGCDLVENLGRVQAMATTTATGGTP